MGRCCMDELGFRHLAETRRSVREFDVGRSIPRHVIEAILDAGRLAPSAKNRQPWRFAIVTDPSMRRRIAQSMRLAATEMGRRNVPRKVLQLQIGSLLESAEILSDAPCAVFVFCASDDSWTDGNEPGWKLSLDDLQAVEMMGIGACMQNATLMATSMGVASLWMCDVLYAADEIQEALGLELPLVAAMLLGYEADCESEPHAGRNPLADSIIWSDMDRAAG